MFNNYENSDKLEWLCPKEVRGDVQPVVTRKEDLNWKKVTVHQSSMGAYPQLGPTGRRRFDNPVGGSKTPKPEVAVIEPTKQAIYPPREVFEPEGKQSSLIPKKPSGSGGLSRSASNFLTPMAKPLSALDWSTNFGPSANNTTVKAKQKLKWMVDTPALVQSDKFREVLKYLKGIDSVTDKSEDLNRALLSLTTYFETLIQKLFGEHKGKFENSEFFKALVADHVKELGIANTPSAGGGQPARKNFGEEGKHMVGNHLSSCLLQDQIVLARLLVRVLGPRKALP